MLLVVSQESQGAGVLVLLLLLLLLLLLEMLEMLEVLGPERTVGAGLWCLGFWRLLLLLLLLRAVGRGGRHGRVRRREGRACC